MELFATVYWWGFFISIPFLYRVINPFIKSRIGDYQRSAFERSDAYLCEKKGVNAEALIRDESFNARRLKAFGVMMAVIGVLVSCLFALVWPFMFPVMFPRKSVQ
jgi:hypothetical protein